MKERLGKKKNQEIWDAEALSYLFEQNEVMEQKWNKQHLAKFLMKIDQEEDINFIMIIIINK